MGVGAWSVECWVQRIMVSLILPLTSASHRFHVPRGNRTRIRGVLALLSSQRCLPSVPLLLFGLPSETHELKFEQARCLYPLNFDSRSASRYKHLWEQFHRILGVKRMGSCTREPRP